MPLGSYHHCWVTWWGTLFLGLFFGFFPKSRGQTPPDSRPNIVLILCDDMGWSDLGCYGGEIQTPHIDRLAREGLRFTHFYNNGKCTTTRASLMTGLYPREGRGPLLGQAMLTLAEALKMAGYQTAMSGKWHLGSQSPFRPIDRGFDDYYGLMDGACHYFEPTRPDPDFKQHRVRVFAHNDLPITSFEEGFYTTDAFSDQACRQIMEMAARPQPFFLHLAYTAPHYPLHAPAEVVARYQGKYLLGWEKLRELRHRRQIELGLVDPGWKLPLDDPLVEPWGQQAHPSWQAERMAVYAAMVDRMDQGIGKVLKTLRQAGVDRETLVVFLSDNGGCSEVYAQDRMEFKPGSGDHYMTCGPGWAHAQNTPFRRFKTWMHEGGIATPMIVRWPERIAPNTVTQQMGHVMDFMPTFLELAGASYPSTYRGQDLIPLEGRSLLPVFHGRDTGWIPDLKWAYRGCRAIRQGDWKLVWDRAFKHWELYHLVHDRTEMTDLSLQYPDRVQAMAESWELWAVHLGIERASLQ